MKKIEPRDPPSRPTSPRRPARAAQARVAYDWKPFERDTDERHQGEWDKEGRDRSSMFAVSALRASYRSGQSGTQRVASVSAPVPTQPLQPFVVPHIANLNPPDWPVDFTSDFDEDF